MRWSDQENSVISFINAYNTSVTNSGYKNMKYTNAEVYDIWEDYFSSQSRGFESLKHKLRLDSFSLDTAIIEFLTSNTANTIADMAKFFNIFEFLAIRCIEYYETKYMKKLYNRVTEEIDKDSMMDSIVLDPDNTTYTDSAIVIENAVEIEEHEPIKESIEKKIDIPDAPVRKKGKNAQKKITKKSKIRTLSESEREHRAEEVREYFEEKKEEEPFSALKQLVNTSIIKVKLGVISDTHIGSMFFDKNALDDFYKRCNDLGIKYVLHAGDLTDGNNLYSGQSKEQDLHGFEEQVRYVIANYPKYPGIKTYVISGNHDMSYYNNTVLHPIISISRSRDDIIFCKDYYANIELDDIKITMIHTDGNSSSEPMTKLKKLITSRIKDCDIMIMGHLHQAMELREFCGVHYACAPGSYVKDNPYTIRRGLNNNVGGYILDIEKNIAMNTMKVTSTWIAGETI